MKRFILNIIAIAALSTLQACKKDLNALPENSRVAEVAIVDAKTAEIALNGAYANFANVASSLSSTSSGGIPRTNWTSHERYPAMFAGYLGYGYGQLPEEENQTSGDGSVYWEEEYRLLNAVNGALKGVSSLPGEAFTGSRRAEIVAELHFLRAYAHFKLLSFYGQWFDVNSAYGVLLRDAPSTKSNIFKARSTVKESYDFIVTDLEDAIANAPAARPNYYATKSAAMLLKMRVLISRGAAADYTEVINLADKIIQNGTYTLEADVKDIFHTKGLASKVVILGLKSQPNQEKDYYSRSAQFWPGASAIFVAKGTLKNLLANDPRQAWMIGSANPYSSYSPNTFYFTKYMIQGGTPTTVSETFYAMRLSEVYLLKAEAIVRSGGNLGDAKTILKTVMGHAGVTDFTAVDNANTPADLLLQIYYENSKNLVAEDGQEWLSLLRLGLNTVKQLRPTIITQAQYILPIPHTEFIYNPTIGAQNPGYSK